jgi:hypothetical protein
MLTTNGGIVTSLPITRKVAPVSPNERVKDRITPVKIPLFNNGREIDSTVLYALAPRVIEASSYKGMSEPSNVASIGSTTTGTEKTICVKIISHIPGFASFIPPGPHKSSIDKPSADVGTISGTLSKALRIPPNLERIIINTVGIAIHVAT